MSSVNLGDIVFQLFYLIFISIIIALVVSIFRSSRQRKNQLDRIEKKVDEMAARIKGREAGGRN